MRKQGYLYMRAENNIENPVRRSKKIDNSVRKYFVCTYSLGQYSKKFLYKHVEICKQRPATAERASRNCLARSQTFFTTLKSKNQSKIREMARMLIILKDINSSVHMIFDAMKPGMFQDIITATKVISGYDSINKSYKSPSLAPHMGTNLKLLCDIALKIVIENIALKVIKEKQWQKPNLLPSAEDIENFRTYVNDLANSTYIELRQGKWTLMNYRTLTECVLAFTVMFNRKRIGDVQYLKIETYTKNESTSIQEAFGESLTLVEKIISKKFKRVVTEGKGSKPVPILLSSLNQKFIRE
ncbi:hypothetical protein HHI36_014819 [Cryptolaemus montrouzieri]|uniref:Uncharacterized protein n=1 Tax=Cryptolaemus montrouzieri TaxID=559131 RepID=A0ABD2N4Y8_9CUCU